MSGFWINSSSNRNNGSMSSSIRRRNVTSSISKTRIRIDDDDDVSVVVTTKEQQQQQQETVCDRDDDDNINTRRLTNVFLFFVIASFLLDSIPDWTIWSQVLPVVVWTKSSASSSTQHWTCYPRLLRQYHSTLVKYIGIHQHPWMLFCPEVDSENVRVAVRLAVTTTTTTSASTNTNTTATETTTIWNSPNWIELYSYEKMKQFRFVIYYDMVRRDTTNDALWDSFARHVAFVHFKNSSTDDAHNYYLRQQQQQQQQQEGSATTSPSDTTTMELQLVRAWEYVNEPPPPPPQQLTKMVVEYNFTPEREYIFATYVIHHDTSTKQQFQLIRKQ